MKLIVYLLFSVAVVATATVLTILHQLAIVH